MRGTLQQFSVLASLLLLAACDLRLNEHVMQARTEANQEFRTGNRVDIVKFSHEVNFKGGVNLPSDRDLDRLDAFLNGIQLAYADQVTLRGSTPRRRAALVAYFERLGAAITVQSDPGTRDEVKSRTVKVLVERYVVTPPACPNWSNFDGTEQRNTPGSNYGCAVDAALGYMIANPRDLVEGQPMGPALGAPNVAAQRRYQTDKVKPPRSTGTGGL